MKKCRQCKATFTPQRPMQTVCGNYQCMIEEGRTKRARTLLLKAKRKQSRERRQAAKTKTELAREAQAAFNRYIRIRDKHKPCVSCGQSPYQGQRHAGHFRTTKAASQLRYNTYGCHAQCAQCNNSKSGNIIPYRQELINRIGQDKVEWLENNHNVVKYDRDYLIRLKKVFTRRAKHMERFR